MKEVDKNSLRVRISKWWHGRFYENKDPNIFWFGIERHWTSVWAHKTLDFIKSEWKWLIGFSLTSLGLWIAYLKL